LFPHLVFEHPLFSHFFFGYSTFFRGPPLKACCFPFVLTGHMWSIPLANSPTLTKNKLLFPSCTSLASLLPWRPTAETIFFFLAILTFAVYPLLVLRVFLLEVQLVNPSFSPFLLIPPITLSFVNRLPVNVLPRIAPFFIFRALFFGSCSGPPPIFSPPAALPISSPLDGLGRIDCPPLVGAELLFSALPGSLSPDDERFFLFSSAL